MKAFPSQYFAFLVTLWCAAAVSAEELVLLTTVGVDVFHDDQFDLQVEDTDVSVLAFRPEITLSYENQRYESVARAGATFNNFVDGPFDNSQNFRAGWDLTRHNRSSDIGLNFNFEERLLTDVPEFDDAVNVTSNESIRTRRVGVFYDLALSPVARVYFGYRNSETVVDGVAGFGNENNTVHDVRVAWSEALSPRSTFAVNVDFAAFRPSDPDVLFDIDANIFRISLGGNYELTQRWKVDALVGLDSIDIAESDVLLGGDQLVIEDGDLLPSANIAAVYTAQRDVINISLDTQNSQQLDGVIDRQNTFGVSWKRAVSERISTTVNGRYLSADRNNRDHLRIDAQVNWQPHEQWQYRLSYAYRDQSSETDNLIPPQIVSGESNRVTLTVEYAFDALRFDI